MRRSCLRDEKGIAMVVALVILLVLTLIGFSSISTTTFESNIAGNERLGTDAFYAAEGCIQVGFNQLPDASAIPVTALGTDSRYWSGGPTDKASPKKLTDLGRWRSEHNEVNWGNKRYQVNCAGESSGATKQVETQVIRGPLILSTEYNP
jgi:Tfp pilus assembly protein PilX